MQSPFFSVIIPTYNRKEFLKKAINSVLEQTEKDWELLIVDDGSSDGSQPLKEEIAKEEKAKEEIVKEEKAKEEIAKEEIAKEEKAKEEKAGQNYLKKNIHWFTRKHFGVSSARNYGVKKAKGKWIAFLDSDDLWHPEKLKKQKEFTRQFPNFSIFQCEELWVRNNLHANIPKKHHKKSGNIFKPSLEICFITPSAVCIKKELFEMFGGFDENIPCCEDYDLWLKITAQCNVGLLAENLVTRYEGHHDQLSHSFFAMDRFRIYSLCKLLLLENLTIEQRNMTKIILKKKYSIYLQGAKKRNKNSEKLENLLQVAMNISISKNSEKNLFLESVRGCLWKNTAGS